LFLKNIIIDAKRLLGTIESMGEVGKKKGEMGITRLALSEEDKQARDLLVKWLDDEDLEIKVDSIGNIFGVRPGKDPDAPMVVMGSHLDTVRVLIWTLLETRVFTMGRWEF
jgi:N-carbamoyl-L-amino-acid hydrolase